MWANMHIDLTFPACSDAESIYYSQREESDKQPAVTTRRTVDKFKASAKS